MFISKKKLQEMLREQASSIVTGIQNDESAERTFRQVNHLQVWLKERSRDVQKAHRMASPRGERMAADARKDFATIREAQAKLDSLESQMAFRGDRIATDFKETHDIIKEANDQLDRIEAKRQETPAEEPERDKVGSLADSVSGIFEGYDARIEELKRANQKLQEKHAVLLHSHGILAAEIDRLKKRIERGEEKATPEPVDMEKFLDLEDPDARQIIKTLLDQGYLLTECSLQGDASNPKNTLDPEMVVTARFKLTILHGANALGIKNESLGDMAKERTAKKDPEEPMMRCAFCRKPLSLKMVTPGYQSDIVRFCNPECGMLYAKSREELRVLDIAWHCMNPNQVIQAEEAAELELLAKITAEFPEEVRLIREFKDGLVTIGEKDDPLPVEYPASNMRGIRAHLRSAKTMRERKAEAMRKIAEKFYASDQGNAKMGIGGVDINGFKDLDENCDLAHLLNALTTSSMNAPWGTFKDGNILATYTPERVQELGERLAKSAAMFEEPAPKESTSDKPSKGELKAGFENICRFKTEASLLGMGMLTGADILAMSPEERESIKQRIREAKERRKDHLSPAMGAFRVQGSNGDVIEPLIPGKGPNASARTTCMHGPASLLGSLYGLGFSALSGRPFTHGRATPKSTALHGVYDNTATMRRESWVDGTRISAVACDDAMEANEDFPWGYFPDLPRVPVKLHFIHIDPAREEAVSGEIAAEKVVAAMNEVFQKEWEKSIVTDMTPSEPSGPNLGGDAFDAEAVPQESLPTEEISDGPCNTDSDMVTPEKEEAKEDDLP